MKEPIILLANGDFPSHSIPLKALNNAGSIICCDGSVNELSKLGLTPHTIIGDLDSINNQLKNQYSEILIKVKNQNENDLRKAINWLNKQNIHEAIILGATGKREDHTLGNIFTLLEYPIHFKSKIISNFGIFTKLTGKVKIKSFPGEQISIFAFNSKIKLTSNNLKYNFNKFTISNMYSTALNESTNSYFDLEITNGEIILYQAFRENNLN